MKHLIFALLIICCSCKKDETVIPATPQNQTLIQGTWTGTDSNNTGVNVNAKYPVSVVITDKTITINYTNTSLKPPPNRDNPTVWNYSFVQAGGDTKCTLQISSTYAWLVTFNGSKSIVAVTNNNGEDTYTLSK